MAKETERLDFKTFWTAKPKNDDFFVIAVFQEETLALNRAEKTSV